MTSASTRRWIAAAVALLMALSVVTPGALAATPATPTDDAETELASIDAELQQQATNGSTVSVVVRMEQVPDGTFGTAGVGSSGSIETLKEDAEAAQQPVLDYAARTDGVTVERQFWLANAVLLKVDGNSAALEELRTISGVERLHQNFEVELVDHAGNGSAATTDGVHRVNASKAWQVTRGENATVAVLDTGVDASHPDINVSSFVKVNESGAAEPAEPSDSGSHGTHVSGTIVGDNSSGEYIGVAPEAELLHAQVINGSGGTFAQVIGGLEWAVEQDADVASMSLGASGYAAEFVEPVRNARSAGTVVVAASGNTGPGTSSTPGNVPEAIAVGAVDGNQRVAPFSSGEVVNGSVWENQSYDDYVVPDVAAPGVNVTSAVPGGGYAEKSGTSMATPHVAGVLALVMSTGNVSVSAAESAVTETAQKPDFAAEDDTRYGAGIVDAAAAVRYVSSGTVNGTVVDSAGDPVAGATVRTGTETTMTDANGSFAVTTLPGNYTVNVTAAGYDRATTNVSVTEDEQATVEMAVSEPATYTFDLEAGQAYAIGLPGPVEGTVADAFQADDGGMPKGVVYAYDADAGSWYSPPANASLSEFDALSVSVDEAATATVTFQREGGVTSTPYSLDLETGWNFVAPPKRGTPNESFALGTAEPARILATHQEAPSAAVHGEAITGGIELGAGDDELSPFNGYFVYVESNGSVQGTTYEGMIRPEANTNLDMETAPITGQVVDEAGNPVAGAVVTAEGSGLATTAGANGTFELTGVAIDSTDVTLSVSADGYSAAQATADAGTDAGTVTLASTAGEDIRVTNATIEYVNGSYALNASVMNAGGAAGERQVNLSLSSFNASKSVVATQNVSLSAGANTTVQFALDGQTITENSFATVTAGQSFETVRLDDSLTAPQVESATTVNNTTVAVQFDRNITLNQSDASGITLTVNDISASITAGADGDTLLLELAEGSEFQSGQNITVAYSGEADNIVSAGAGTEAPAFEAAVNNTL